MIAKLIPVLMLALGLGAGVGAGFFFRPDPVVPQQGAENAGDANGETGAEEGAALGREYVKLNNQFVVPVIDGESVGALVVMELSVEVNEGDRAVVFEQEPKLRDAFLRVLFDHANIGGFDGRFTDLNRLEDLLRTLHDAATQSTETPIYRVMVSGLARQDL